MRLNKQGFITDYLISGPIETDIINSHQEEDQLKYEKHLRKDIVETATHKPNQQIQIGEVSALGKPWHYYYDYGNWFVDQSKFYSLLKKVEFYAVTHLVAGEAGVIEANLWTYGACEIWVNGTLVCSAKTPVYKPIKKEVIQLPLLKGDNELFIRFQNLGVRDTRNLFGIQLMSHQELVEVKLPDWQKSHYMVDAAKVLNTLDLKEGVLYVRELAKDPIYLTYDYQYEDFSKQQERFKTIEITHEQEIKLLKDAPSATVSITTPYGTISRKLEMTEAIQPIYRPQASRMGALKYTFTEIAKIGQMLRGKDECFAMYPLLARKALGLSKASDTADFLNDLEHIEVRRDCSDFLASALVRYCKLNELTPEEAIRVKEVLLDYRYWMDEEGADGMCFWSENHSLMFYTTAYFAGQMYPSDTFKRSGKKGEQLTQDARIRLMDWLKDTHQYGFEEFQSGGYTPITFCALLTLVDFAEEEMSLLATKVVDKLIRMLALHSFKGSVISPQGRVYREVLYPFAQDVQQLLYMIDPDVPYHCSEWVSIWATSKYQLPAGLKQLMSEPITTSYVNGNACINLCKRPDYMVTSVASPRTDSYPVYWDNVSEQAGVDKGSFEYCKSLNERFHGTSKFEPGVYGYQQHMWYAALDVQTVVFVNHPGGSCDSTTTRPGYWFGNGEMPALKQDKALIGAIYNISESHPIAFTHVYFPQKRFEEVKHKGNWYFGKKKGSYLGIWCSKALQPYQDQLFDCELRAYGRHMAYLCQCGSEEEYGSFEGFVKYCQGLNPHFDGSTLEASEAFRLEYRRYNNKTQYV